MSRLRLFALLIVIVGVVAQATPVGAHARLLSSCPGAGDRLRELSVIELTFSEPILDDGLAEIDLIDTTGEESFEVGPVQFSDDRETLSVDVLEELEAGFYVVRVTGTSADGDINGADLGFQFEIDPDRSPESETCDLPPESNSAGWILLGVGLVAVLAAAFFLRPSGDGEEEDEDDDAAQV